MTSARSEPRAPNAAPPMAGRSRRAIITFLAIAVGVLALDLASKWLAFEYVAGDPVVLGPPGEAGRHIIPPHDEVTIVPKVLALKLVLNEGAVFGIGQGGRWFFVAISIVAVGVIGTIFWRSGPHQRLLHLVLALILAGALGNLYDRMRFGVVRDLFYLFPEVHLPFGWQWPGGSGELYPWIFNIADAALVAGMVLLVIASLRRPKARTTEAQRTQRQENP